MTDPTPYTDADVQELAAALQHTSNVGSGFEDDARRLLDKGYRKVAPPEEPEPQERYYVDGDFVHDRHDPELVAYRCPSHREAERIARLLNLDAKYEDRGGVAGVIESVDNEARDARLAARLQAERAAKAEAEVERAQRRAEDFKAHLQERVKQRDDARAEVERLTAELAEANQTMAELAPYRPQRPRLTAEDVVSSDRYIGPQSVADALNAILDAKAPSDSAQEPFDGLIRFGNPSDEAGKDDAQPKPIDMVTDLHKAIYGDTWARPQPPEAVWDELLAHVEGLAAGRCHVCCDEVHEAPPEDAGNAEPLFEGRIEQLVELAWYDDPNQRVAVYPVDATPPAPWRCDACGSVYTQRTECCPADATPATKPGLRWVAVGSAEFEAECQKRNASVATPVPRAVTGDEVQRIWVEAHQSRAGRVFELMATALNERLFAQPTRETE